MRIALLTQYYKPEMGAPQNRLFEMVRGLAALGNELCVVTGMPNYPTGRIFSAYRGRFSCTEQLDGVCVRRYWLYASNVKRTLPRVWNMVSFTLTALCALPFLRRRRPDFLIVETPPLTLAWMGRWLARLCGARFVANVSDLWPLSAKELGALHEGALYHFLERVERDIYRHADLCMGQSDEIVRHMAQHGARRTYLFRNGVDPARFAGLARAPRQDGPTRIVYAGLLGFAQGIADICRHVDFAALGAEFHIYGAGGEQADIEAYIAAHPQCGITYHGVVSRDALPAVLVSHDMTLIPLVKNIYGAVPSKIYESMAAGLPILFAGEGEGAAIVRDNGLGLVSAAKDYAALARNIAHAQAHPEALRGMADNCRRCAAEKFNRPRQIAGLDAFLRQMC